MLRARVLLVAVAAVFVPLFAVPLLADPYWWGDVFGWDTSARSDLGTYLGRCLGALALALAATSLVAVRDPVAYRGLFDAFALSALLLGVVHAAGLLQGTQPVVEHLEIALYAAFAALAWWCKPR